MRASFAADPAAQYDQKLIARFVAGDAPDALFVREESMVSWAQAEYIRPLNDFPGWQGIASQIKPHNLISLQYDGKLWGLPYYGDHIAFIYNADMLQKAGIKEPAKTWSELADQALAIKKAKLIDRPIVFPVKGASGLYWWAAVYGSGGSLFDAQGNPKFPDQDTVSLQVLEFLVRAARELDILDMASLQMGSPEVRQAFNAGQVAFCPSPRYDLKLYNDPAKSKVAGMAKQMLMPSLSANGPNGTFGWTHMYSIARKSPHPEKAWDLLKYVSSPEAQKRFYVRNGVGYTYTSLDKDAEVIAETNRWSEQEIAIKQGSLAKSRENLTFSWTSEWEIFHMQQVQEALTGRKSARAALVASADKARELKKNG